MSDLNDLLAQVERDQRAAEEAATERISSLKLELMVIEPVQLSISSKPKKSVRESVIRAKHKVEADRAADAVREALMASQSQPEPEETPVPDPAALLEFRETPAAEAEISEKPENEAAPEKVGFFRRFINKYIRQGE